MRKDRNSIKNPLYWRGVAIAEFAVATDAYVDAMVENIKENGPYVVIWPGTALPHADCLEGVKQEAASLLRLKKPVDFHHESNDPVRYNGLIN